MTSSPRRVGAPSRPASLLLLTAALTLVGAVVPRPAAATASLSVSYRTADAVYLDGGRAVGVEVGDELEVVRDGEVIARLEVVFAAEQSASCRVLSESAAIADGDLVRRVGGEPFVGAAPAAESVAEDEAAAAPAAVEEPVAAPRQTYERRRTTRWSGTLSYDVDIYTDDTDEGESLDTTRSTTRLSLRGRDLGGRPLTFRLRGRMQEVDRDRRSETESRDRLYEVSLAYGTEATRFRFALGRVGASPYVGIGYLDGLLGEVRLGRRFHLGLFAGSEPDIEELGFESMGERYGAYVRLHSPVEDRGLPPFEVLLGGVREEGDLDVSREYALVEMRYSGGGIWYFRQRAEIDLNNGWREELADSSSQLSNLSLSASARISDRRRFTLSYTRFERYRTEETRFIDEELFDDLWRQGLRASLELGPSRGLRFSLQAGIRSQEDGEEDAVTFGVGVRHPDMFSLGLGGSLYVTTFTNEFVDGTMANARLSKRFRRGHSLSLSLGGRTSTSAFTDEDRQLVFGRLGFWLELPANLYARGDFEMREEEEVSGTLTSLGLGIRF